jgi:serine O-acetyltransferase
MFTGVFDLDRWLSFVFRRLSSQLHEDWCLHWRDWTQPGFRAVVVYRFGARLLRNQTRGVKTRVLLMLYRTMYRYIRNYYGIDLPATTIVGRRLVIGHRGGIVIHPRAVIGDDCVILQNVTIGAATVLRHWEAPVIGNRVQVGAGAVIIGKVKIGDDVSIGPNVSVLTNIPTGTTVCPQPPRLINLQSKTTLRAWDVVTCPRKAPKRESLTSKE